MNISIISSSELAQDLNNGRKRYCLVDARAAAEYERGHIAGAVHIPWEDWCAQAARPALSAPGFWGLLDEPCPGRFSERLSALGLSNGRPIIVYADGSQSAGREGRIAWMLLYLGACRVFLLNGGFSGWLKEVGVVASGRRALQEAGQFRLAIAEHRRVKLSRLQDLHDSGQMPVMVDTRSAREFRGECFDYQPRKGRLPRSVLLPFSSLFDRAGRYVSRRRYLAMLPAELRNAASMVAYCEVGVRAATFALLHEAYTGQVVPVFDGSVMEWACHPGLPVLTA